MHYRSLNNLDKIMEGIELKTEFTEPVTGFPVIFSERRQFQIILQPLIHASIRKVFPAAELIVIQGAGHWIHADKPDEVIKYLRKLLDAS